MFASCIDTDTVNKCSNNTLISLSSGKCCCHKFCDTDIKSTTPDKSRALRLKKMQQLHQLTLPATKSERSRQVSSSRLHAAVNQRASIEVFQDLPLWNIAVSKSHPEVSHGTQQMLASPRISFHSADNL